MKKALLFLFLLVQPVYTDQTVLTIPNSNVNAHIIINGTPVEQQSDNQQTTQPTPTPTHQATPTPIVKVIYKTILVTPTDTPTPTPTATPSPTLTPTKAPGKLQKPQPARQSPTLFQKFAQFFQGIFSFFHKG